jgi:peptidoglycan/LPS O-acetylase OafA/YrhL
VLGFFILSGYVLARGYDGRPAAFLLRRVVRLGPVYWVAISASAALAGRLPSLAELSWWPTAMMTNPDRPSWSLFVEVAVSPALPLVFAATRRLPPAIVAPAALAVALLGPSWPSWTAAFVLGASLSRYDAGRLPVLFIRVAAAPLRVLGEVSYPLYLAHWPAIAVGTAWFGLPYGPWAGLPLAALATFVLYRLVEIPSVRLARAAGRLDLDLRRYLDPKGTADAG